MYQPFPTIGIVAGITALQGLACQGYAVSPEAQYVRDNVVSVLNVFEKSQVLFGAKAEAISHLYALGAEEQNPNLISVAVAEKFIRALPDAFRLPEFSFDPDGSISLDWIESRTRVFSISVSENSRLAYAWLNGNDKGHAVADFDGQIISELVLEGIKSIA